MLGDKILNSVEYKNIPVSASTTAKLVIQNLDTAPEISIDINGDGTIDTTLTGNESNDTLASIEILKSMVSSMDINKGLKKHILRDLSKAEKEFIRGRTEKAVKYLDKIIKKLKQEINKNLRKEDDDKDEEMGHKKGKNHHRGKEKISTKDAWMLISIIEDIKI